MHLEKQDLHLEVAVHLGTLGSVVVYYRRLLVGMVREAISGGPARRLAILVVLGTIPVVVVGAAVKRVMGLRESPNAPMYAGIALVVIGCFLLATIFARPRAHEPNWVDALIV